MKLKAPSSKLKRSFHAQIQNAVRSFGLGDLTLEFLLNFELWFLNFASA
jgi:hypothetical protein